VQILITGATGLVGNNCLRVLAGQGHRLHTLVRPNCDCRPFQGLDVQFHYADLREISELRDAIPTVDTIIHAGADTHIGSKPRAAQRVINVDATRAIAQAALEHGSKLVFVSSVDALPSLGPDMLVTEETVGAAKYPCGYVATKRIHAGALGLETIVRPHVVGNCHAVHSVWPERRV